MRRIERTSAFKRDYKREAKGQHRKVLAAEFVGIVQALADDEPLAERLRDHPLVGEWQDHRDCHIRPDLVLIYRKPDTRTLQLVRLGSYSELSLKKRASPLWPEQERSHEAHSRHRSAQELEPERSVSARSNYASHLGVTLLGYVLFCWCF